MISFGDRVVFMLIKKAEYLAGHEIGQNDNLII
jgi:hypothetical protein